MSKQQSLDDKTADVFAGVNKVRKLGHIKIRLMLTVLEANIRNLRDELDAEEFEKDEEL